MALVTGNIRPVGTTIGYRLALALVGVMMILLPLIYVAMIVGVMVAATFGPVTSMYCTASRVVMCSSTIFSLET